MHQRVWPIIQQFSSPSLKWLSSSSSYCSNRVRTIKASTDRWGLFYRDQKSTKRRSKYFGLLISLRFVVILLSKYSLISDKVEICFRVKDRLLVNWTMEIWRITRESKLALQHIDEHGKLDTSIILAEIRSQILNNNFNEILNNDHIKVIHDKSHRTKHHRIRFLHRQQQQLSLKMSLNYHRKQVFWKVQRTEQQHHIRRLFLHWQHPQQPCLKMWPNYQHKQRVNWKVHRMDQQRLLKKRRRLQSFKLNWMKWQRFLEKNNLLLKFLRKLLFMVWHPSLSHKHKHHLIRKIFQNKRHHRESFLKQRLNFHQ